MPLNLDDIDIVACTYVDTASASDGGHRPEFVCVQMLYLCGEHIEDGELNGRKIRVHRGKLVLAVEDVQELDIFIKLHQAAHQ